MDRKNRICAVCRNEYQFCNKCREDSNKPLWFFSFCSENCHDIYETTSKFEDNRIDAHDAKLKLNNLDLSKLDNFGESYKKSINKIMSSVSVKENAISEERIEINTVEQVVEKENNSTTEDVVEEKVFRKSKNKRARSNVEE